MLEDGATEANLKALEREVGVAQHYYLEDLGRLARHFLRLRLH
jgi:hypothetical protein